MKLTNAEMWDAVQVLSQTKEMGKLGYACARNLRKLLAESKEYMQTRDELLTKYGEDQGNGKYNILPEKMADFTAEMNAYGQIEHDVDIMTVSEEIFCSGTLTTKDMFALGFMCEEEAE